MHTFIKKRHRKGLYRGLSILLTCILSLTWVFPFPPTPAFAQTVLGLPAPGIMVAPSTGFTPAVIRAVKIHPENPFQFDFVIDTGDSGLAGVALEEESSKLIKYFLASLTVPEDDLWVNLSPYEKDKIIPEEFGLTEMGRDMLAQDYLLKQLTASLINPEEDLGKSFWDKIYAKAYSLYGTTHIPVNTFNKVWILPERAVVYETEGMAFVSESRLKVMLDKDYLSLQKNMDNTTLGTDRLAVEETQEISDVSSSIVRDVILPEIEREVNEGKNFAPLRQIYHSLILATWYKRNLRESILGQIYVDKAKINGINLEDKEVKRKIYDQYLAAFKKGVYNFIREDYDPYMQETIPRKYFSGGVRWKTEQAVEVRKVQRPRRAAGLLTNAVAGAAMLASVFLQGCSGGACPQGKPDMSSTEISQLETRADTSALGGKVSPDHFTFPVHPDVTIIPDAVMENFSPFGKQQVAMVVPSDAKDPRLIELGVGFLIKLRELKPRTDALSADEAGEIVNRLFHRGKIILIESEARGPELEDTLVHELFQRDTSAEKTTRDLFSSAFGFIKGDKALNDLVTLAFGETDYGDLSYREFWTQWVFPTGEPGVSWPELKRRIGARANEGIPGARAIQDAITLAEGTLQAGAVREARELTPLIRQRMGNFSFPAVGDTSALAGGVVFAPQLRERFGRVVDFDAQGRFVEVKEGVDGQPLFGEAEVRTLSEQSFRDLLDGGEQPVVSQAHQLLAAAANDMQDAWDGVYRSFERLRNENPDRFSPEQIRQSEDALSRRVQVLLDRVNERLQVKRPLPELSREHVRDVIRSIPIDIPRDMAAAELQQIHEMPFIISELEAVGIKGTSKDEWIELYTPLIVSLAFLMENLLDLHKQANTPELQAANREFVNEILDALDQEILPQMQRLGLKLAYHFPKARQWLVYVLLPFYKGDGAEALLVDRSKALIAYAEEEDDETTALLLGWNGLHLRALHRADLKEVDFQVQPLLLDDVMVKTQRLIAKRGKKAKNFAQAVINGLVIDHSEYFNVISGFLSQVSRVQNPRGLIKQLFEGEYDISENRANLVSFNKDLGSREALSLTKAARIITAWDLATGSPFAQEYLEQQRKAAIDRSPDFYFDYTIKRLGGSIANFRALRDYALSAPSTPSAPDTSALGRELEFVQERQTRIQALQEKVFVTAQDDVAFEERPEELLAEVAEMLEVLDERLRQNRLAEGLGVAPEQLAPQRPLEPALRNAIWDGKRLFGRLLLLTSDAYSLPVKEIKRGTAIKKDIASELVGRKELSLASIKPLAASAQRLVQGRDLGPVVQSVTDLQYWEKMVEIDALIGNEIRRRRIKNELTLEEMTTMTKIPTATIGSIERGKYGALTKDVLEKIAKALNVRSPLLLRPARELIIQTEELQKEFTRKRKSAGNAAKRILEDTPGLSLRKLARRIKVSSSSLSYRLRNSRNQLMKPQYLPALAAGLGVEITDFWSGDDLVVFRFAEQPAPTAPDTSALGGEVALNGGVLRPLSQGSLVATQGVEAGAQLPEVVLRANGRDGAGNVIIMDFRPWTVYDFIAEEGVQARLVEFALSERERFERNRRVWDGLSPDERKALAADEQWKDTENPDWPGPPRLLLVPAAQMQALGPAFTRTEEGFLIGDNAFALQKEGNWQEFEAGQRDLLTRVPENEYVRVSAGSLARVIVKVAGQEDHYLLQNNALYLGYHGEVRFQPFGGAGDFVAEFVEEAKQRFGIIPQWDDNHRVMVFFIPKNKLQAFRELYDQERQSGEQKNFVPASEVVRRELLEEMGGEELDGSPAMDGLSILPIETFHVKPSSDTSALAGVMQFVQERQSRIQALREKTFITEPGEAVLEERPEQLVAEVADMLGVLDKRLSRVRKQINASLAKTVRPLREGKVFPSGGSGVKDLVEASGVAEGTIYKIEINTFGKPPQNHVPSEDIQNKLAKGLGVAPERLAPQRPLERALRDAISDGKSLFARLLLLTSHAYSLSMGEIARGAGLKRGIASEANGRKELASVSIRPLSDSVQRLVQGRDLGPAVQSMTNLQYWEKTLEIDALIGREIRRRRVDMKMSSKDMAEAIKIARPSLSRIEQGKYGALPREVLVNIAEALDVESVEVLLHPARELMAEREELQKEYARKRKAASEAFKRIYDDTPGMNLRILAERTKLDQGTLSYRVRNHKDYLLRPHDLPTLADGLEVEITDLWPQDDEDLGILRFAEQPAPVASDTSALAGVMDVREFATLQEDFGRTLEEELAAEPQERKYNNLMAYKEFYETVSLHLVRKFNNPPFHDASYGLKGARVYLERGADLAHFFPTQPRGALIALAHKMLSDIALRRHLQSKEERTPAEEQELSDINDHIDQQVETLVKNIALYNRIQRKRYDVLEDKFDLPRYYSLPLLILDAVAYGTAPMTADQAKKTTEVMRQYNEAFVDFPAPYRDRLVAARLIDMGYHLSYRLDWEDLALGLPSFRYALEGLDQNTIKDASDVLAMKLGVIKYYRSISERIVHGWVKEGYEDILKEHTGLAQSYGPQILQWVGEIKALDQKHGVSILEGRWNFIDSVHFQTPHVLDSQGNPITLDKIVGDPYRFERELNFIELSHGTMSLEFNGESYRRLEESLQSIIRGDIPGDTSALGGVMSGRDFVRFQKDFGRTLQVELQSGPDGAVSAYSNNYTHRTIFRDYYKAVSTQLDHKFDNPPFNDASYGLQGAGVYLREGLPEGQSHHANDTPRGVLIAMTHKILSDMTLRRHLESMERTPEEEQELEDINGHIDQQFEVLEENITIYNSVQQKRHDIIGDKPNLPKYYSLPLLVLDAVAYFADPEKSAPIMTQYNETFIDFPPAHRDRLVAARLIDMGYHLSYNYDWEDARPTLAFFRYALQRLDEDAFENESDALAMKLGITKYLHSASRRISLNLSGTGPGANVVREYGRLIQSYGPKILQWIDEVKEMDEEHDVSIMKGRWDFLFETHSRTPHFLDGQGNPITLDRIVSDPYRFKGEIQAIYARVGPISARAGPISSEFREAVYQELEGNIKTIMLDDIPAPGDTSALGGMRAEEFNDLAERFQTALRQEPAVNAESGYVHHEEYGKIVDEIQRHLREKFEYSTLRDQSRYGISSAEFFLSKTIRQKDSPHVLTRDRRRPLAVLLAMAHYLLSNLVVMKFLEDKEEKTAEDVAELAQLKKHFEKQAEVLKINIGLYNAVQRQRWEIHSSDPRDRYPEYYSLPLLILDAISPIAETRNKELDYITAINRALPDMPGSETDALVARQLINLGIHQVAGVDVDDMILAQPSLAYALERLDTGAVTDEDDVLSLKLGIVAYYMAQRETLDTELVGHLEGQKARQAARYERNLVEAYGARILEWISDIRQLDQSHNVTIMSVRRGWVFLDRKLLYTADFRDAAGNPVPLDERFANPYRYPERWPQYDASVATKYDELETVVRKVMDTSLSAPGDTSALAGVMGVEEANKFMRDFGEVLTEELGAEPAEDVYYVEKTYSKSYQAILKHLENRHHGLPSGPVSYNLRGAGSYLREGVHKGHHEHREPRAVLVAMAHMVLSNMAIRKLLRARGQRSSEEQSELDDLEAGLEQQVEVLAQTIEKYNRLQQKRQEQFSGPSSRKPRYYSLPLLMLDAVSYYADLREQMRVLTEYNDVIEEFPQKYRDRLAAGRLIDMGFHLQHHFDPEDLPLALPALRYALERLDDGTSFDEKDALALKLGVTKYLKASISKIELRTWPKVGESNVHVEQRTLIKRYAPQILGWVGEIAALDEEHDFSILLETWDFIDQAQNALPHFLDEDGNPLTLDRIVSDPYRYKEQLRTFLKGPERYQKWSTVQLDYENLKRNIRYVADHAETTPDTSALAGELAFVQERHRRIQDLEDMTFVAAEGEVEFAQRPEELLAEVADMLGGLDERHSRVREKIRASLAKTVKPLRQQKVFPSGGSTLKDLAAASGVGLATISKIERNEFGKLPDYPAVPSEDIQNKLAKGLGVAPETLAPQRPLERALRDAMEDGKSLFSRLLILTSEAYSLPMKEISRGAGIKRDISSDLIGRKQLAFPSIKPLLASVQSLVQGRDLGPVVQSVTNLKYWKKMVEIDARVGEEISRRRLDKKLTLDEVSSTIRIPGASLGAIERGKYGALTKDVLEKIAEALGVKSPLLLRPARELIMETERLQKEFTAKRKAAGKAFKRIFDSTPGMTFRRLASETNVGQTTIHFRLNNSKGYLLKPQHLPALAAGLGVEITAFWPQEDLAVFRFAEKPTATPDTSALAGVMVMREFMELQQEFRQTMREEFTAGPLEGTLIYNDRKADYTRYFETVVRHLETKFGNAPFNDVFYGLRGAGEYLKEGGKDTTPVDQIRFFSDSSRGILIASTHKILSDMVLRRRLQAREGRTPAEEEELTLIDENFGRQLEELEESIAAYNNMQRQRYDAFGDGNGVPRYYSLPLLILDAVAYLARGDENIETMTRYNETFVDFPQPYRDRLTAARLIDMGYHLRQQFDWDDLAPALPSFRYALQRLEKGVFADDADALAMKLGVVKYVDEISSHLAADKSPYEDVKSEHRELLKSHFDQILGWINEVKAIEERQGISILEGRWQFIGTIHYVLPHHLDIDGNPVTLDQMMANPYRFRRQLTDRESFHGDRLLLLGRFDEVAYEVLEKQIRNIVQYSRFDDSPPSTGDTSALAGGAQDVKELGGIDFTPGNLELYIKRDEQGMPLPVNQQPLETINIDGLIPIIINITPVTNLPLLFGMTGEEGEDTDSAKFSPAEPARLSRLP